MTDRRAAWSRTKRNLRAMRGFLFLDYGSIRDELNSRKFQRGRATGGAEFFRFLCDVEGVSLLQRGRATGGAEFEVFHDGEIAVFVLQRGRATGGAEFASSKA